MFARAIVMAAVVMLLTAFTASPAFAASHEATTQRQSEEQSAEAKIDELDRNMQELQEKSRGTGEQPRAEINRLYEEFKDQQKAARRGLENLRKSTNESWDKARQELDKAIENLRGLYDRTRAKMKEKEGPENK